ncbi:glycoside hydrolase family 3 protein [Knoellia subterranea]|uniref:Sugar hydrolase n=1 Tax=Knoellia subterranea KCTC 19937 TaxID=1385521 RepID=A0A0A0JNQ8_9MICO|nr:glycoside hydrolase family 3 N-terminal domain-containing protein [Knoellia subterranea]KGN37261.1 sugar hydrolase [Knoellia subterranea KCTC 19937]
MNGSADTARSSHRSPDLRALALAVVQPGFVGLTPPDWLRRELDAGLGGVALFARNIDTLEQVDALTTAIHAARPGALIAVDEEAGDVTRLEHSTGSSWPGNLALGVVDDEALTEAVAREIGVLLDSVGIDLVYAPVADVNNNPANPVIGVRSFGADARLVARHTGAWVRGIQSAGVLACAKHFPGHGDTAVDSHLGLPEVDFIAPDDAVLQPFRAAIEAGTVSIMSAHIVVRGLDDRPSTLSHRVLVDLLRGQLGFGGLALSDGMEMGGITGAMSLQQGCVRAIAAGIDLLCIGGGLADEDTVLTVVDELVSAVHSGRLDEARLADAASRVQWAAEERQRLRAAAEAGTESASTGGAGAEAVRTGGVGTESIVSPRARAAVHKPAGLDAARRAVVVRGPVRAFDRLTAPVIVELVAPSNIAVGHETRSGISAAAIEHWPGLTPLRADTEEAVARAVAGTNPSDRVWLVVRDPRRRAWMEAALDRVLADHPDAVVIDTGWPGWTAPEGTTHVVTHGAARVTADAVVSLLTEG